MKVTIDFTGSEDEQEAYKEFDLIARTMVAGARMSLVAAGATEEDITKVLDEVKYNAVSSSEGATIELNVNIDNIFELLDDMDLDLDKLKTFGNLMHS